MASLFKPTIVTYRLKDGSYRTPDGKRVTKNTPGAVRTVEESKKWYGRWTDGAGRPHREPLSESKDIARRMLAKLAGDSQLAGVGIVDPFADHRRRPLTEHLEDYRRYLSAKGNCAKYVSNTEAQIKAVLDGCRFQFLDDLQPSAVVEFLGRLRADRARPLLPPGQEEFTTAELAALLKVRLDSVRRLVRAGLLPAESRSRGRHSHTFRREDVEAYLDRRRAPGVETSNHYLTAMKGFTHWLARERRIIADPLSHLSRMNADTDVRHPRRALREEVFARFVEATGDGKVFRGLTGADRLVLYTLAANTGFRAGELGSLTPASFDLVTDPPTVTVAAGYSKHRRKDVQPLRSDVAEMMRQYIAGRPRNEPLWPGSWTDAGAEMVRLDLAAAGIPYQDEDGRYFDFHAVRGQFISLLAANGVHPKVAQTLARHSTITLTMDYYTHLDVFNVSGVLDKLPGLACSKRPETRDEAQSA
jgi:excisionase family DNA binding protein